MNAKVEGARTNSYSIVGLVFIFSMTFTISLRSSAQDLEQQPIVSNVELLGGPNWCFLRGSSVVDNGPQSTRSMKHGYSFGINLTHNFNPRISLDLLMLYELKGSISNQTGPLTSTLVDFKYQYLTLPVILNYSVDPKSRFKLGLGFFAGYLQKQTQTETQSAPGTAYTRDLTGQSLSWDAGLAAQVSYKISLGNSWVVTPRILLQTGLVNTRPDFYAGQGIYTNSTSLMIGISKPQNHK